MPSRRRAARRSRRATVDRSSEEESMLRSQSRRPSADGRPQLLGRLALARLSGSSTSRPSSRCRAGPCPGADDRCQSTTSSRVDAARDRRARLPCLRRRLRGRTVTASPSHRLDRRRVGPGGTHVHEHARSQPETSPDLPAGSPAIIGPVAGTGLPRRSCSLNGMFFRSIASGPASCGLAIATRPSPSAGRPPGHRRPPPGPRPRRASPHGQCRSLFGRTDGIPWSQGLGHGRTRAPRPVV